MPLPTEEDQVKCFGEGEDVENIQLSCCLCFGPVLRALTLHDNITQALFRKLRFDRSQLLRAERYISSVPLPWAAREVDDVRTNFRALVSPILTRALVDLEEMRSLVEPGYPQLSGAIQLVNQIYIKQRRRYKIANAPASGCVANTFVQDCVGRHAGVFLRFPPVHGPAREGHLMDFVGVTTAWQAFCVQDGVLRLVGAAPSRYHLCKGHEEGTLLRQWPILDEEYFEWSAILEAAAAAARRGGGLRFAEVGSGPYGIWATRAAVAWHRFGPPGAKCELLLVEPEVLNRTQLAGHMAMNLPEGRCEVTAVEAYVGSEDGPSLMELLDGTGDPSEPWDIVDIDAQGAELEMMRSSHLQLAKRVRSLHVSTHSRDIHHEVLGILRANGWTVTVEFAPVAYANIGDYGAFVTLDGHLTALPPSGPQQWRRLAEEAESLRPATWAPG